jgi:hypothetical protein
MGMYNKNKLNIQYRAGWGGIFLCEEKKDNE